MSKKNQQTIFQARRNLFHDINSAEGENLGNTSHEKNVLAEFQNDEYHNHHQNRNTSSTSSSSSSFSSQIPQSGHQGPLTPATRNYIAERTYSSGKEIGRTTSFDLGQLAGPPKKFKPSPSDIDEMPDTPQKEYSSNHDEISESSRLYKDYEIINVLGRGSFGTVYGVRGRIDGRDYAIKKSRRRPHSQHERSSMMLEVHALAALSAQEDSEKTNCIVRYYSAWMEDEYLCIQMELCESSAADVTSFDEDSQFQLLRDIFNALDVLHNNDFVHLDIKPANILVKKNRYKLADFGLALHTTNRKFNGNVEEGDSRYMARELLNWGGVADLTKCDIFSLGISAYELFARKSLEPNGPRWHALRDGIIEPFPPNTSENLISLIHQLMSPDPINRPSAEYCLHNFIELKTPLEIELEKQRLIALELEEELHKLIQMKQASSSS